MNWRTFLIMLWLLAYGLVGMVAYERAGRTPSLEHFLAIGFTVGTVGLVATWLVFGRRSFALRLGAALLVLLVLSRLLSALLHADGPLANRGFGLLLTLHASETLVAIAVMMVLRGCGLRLQTPEGGLQTRTASCRRPSQYSLATLLMIVGFSATLMGAARWTVSLDSAAWEAASFGGVWGGFATLAVALVWLRGFIQLRCAATGFAMVALIVGLFSANIRIGFVVDVLPPMLLFMTASLTVFRVCGYCLERVPHRRHETTPASIQF